MAHLPPILHKVLLETTTRCISRCLHSNYTGSCTSACGVRDHREVVPLTREPSAMLGALGHRSPLVKAQVGQDFCFRSFYLHVKLHLRLFQCRLCALPSEITSGPILHFGHGVRADRIARSLHNYDIRSVELGHVDHLLRRCLTLRLGWNRCRLRVARLGSCRAR